LELRLKIKAYTVHTCFEVRLRVGRKKSTLTRKRLPSGVKARAGSKKPMMIALNPSAKHASELVVRVPAQKEVTPAPDSYLWFPFVRKKLPSRIQDG
jgi:hypothetical protein